MSTDESIAFLGLGNLGAPIAANLLASGKRLSVWNRTADKTAPLVAKGATAAATPEDAVTPGGVVFSILWDDASLEELVARPGFLARLGAGGVHVSMTTVSPGTAQKVAQQHQAHGCVYVEAPIFGVPASAVARQLLLCVAGPSAAKERVRPLFEAMGAQRVADFGERIGAGTATKLVGNYMIISAFGAIQEAFDALAANGLDPKPTLELLTQTLLATPGNQRMVGYLLSGKPVPTSGIPTKDVGLFCQFAEAGHRDVPLAEALLQHLTRR